MSSGFFMVWKIKRHQTETLMEKCMNLSELLTHCDIQNINPIELNDELRVLLAVYSLKIHHQRFQNLFKSIVLCQVHV